MVPWRVKARFLLVGLLIGAAVAGGFGIDAWWKERARLNDAEVACDARVASAEARLGTVGADLARLEARDALLRGRAALARAVVELERHNFGSAGMQLGVAREALDAVDPVAAGIDPAAFEQARGQVAATRVEVASDLGPQHDALVALGASLDALTGGAR